MDTVVIDPISGLTIIQHAIGYSHQMEPVPLNPDPRILMLLVIGTEDNVRAHILRQHTLGVAEAGAWSRLTCPDKVICVLNRIMV